MPMKPLLVFITAILAQSVSAQDGCNLYFNFKEGAVLEYSHYDEAGNLQHKTTQTVLGITTQDGIQEAQVKQIITDDKDKEIMQEAIKAKCKDNVFSIDISTVMPPQTQESFSKVEMVFAGDPLSFPSQVIPGQVLPDIVNDIKTGPNTKSVLSMTMDLTNRRVLAPEIFKTPLGQWTCTRISYTLQTKMMVTKSYSIIEWYAKGVGLVRRETFDKKGNLESKMELTAFQPGN